MSSTVQAAAAQATRPADGRAPHRGLALGLILLAQLLVVIDVSIVTLALPAIQRGLGFSPAGLQWVISAYALAFGGFLLLGGGWPTCWAAGRSWSPGPRCSPPPRWPAGWPGRPGCWSRPAPPRAWARR